MAFKIASIKCGTQFQVSAVRTESPRRAIPDHIACSEAAICPQVDVASASGKDWHRSAGLVTPRQYIQSGISALLNNK